MISGKTLNRLMPVAVISIFALLSLSSCGSVNSCSDPQPLADLGLEMASGDIGATKWIQQFGTTSTECGVGIAVDWSDNSTYVTGFTKGALFGANQGGADAFIAKYDTNGNRLWIQQFGTTGDDYGLAIAVDGIGGAYVTGTTTGSLGGANQGGFDLFITKYDTNGNQLWKDQVVSTSSDEAGYGIDADGSAEYITGFTKGTFAGGNTLANQGGSDAFIAKYDTNGNWSWIQQFGTTGDDYGYGIAFPYVTGYTTGSLGGANQGGDDAFIVKFDSNGNQVRIQQFGTSSHDAGFGISTSTDGLGNPYITGSTKGSLGGANQGDYDAFIAKYDTNLNQTWIRQFGTTSFDDSHGIAVDGSGNPYVTGYTTGSLGGANQGDHDAFIARYDTNGNQVWIGQFGTTGTDYTFGIALDSWGNPEIVGATTGSFGGANQGGDDALVIAVGPIIQYMVTATVGTGGTVTPASQNVTSGLTASFTVTANTGYTTSTTVGGTCAAGSWSGTTYTTGAVTAACSVSFSFTPSSSYTVSATYGTGGSVTPSSRSVTSGSTASFTVTANSGYTTSTSVVSTCATGSWSGTTYTTGAVTAVCSVTFSFTTVTTVAKPTATTGTATNIKKKKATLNGTVNPNGLSTTVKFQYGKTSSYGSRTTAQTLTGSTDQAVSATVTGLTCGTRYHFRVKATNSSGTTKGSDATFRTSACADAP